MPMDELYVREAAGTVQEVETRLHLAVADHAFSILGMFDLQDKMVSKGIEFPRACRVYEVCNPAKAKAVLDQDMRVSTALPCRISLYEDQGRLQLAAILPTRLIGLFEADGAEQTAIEVEVIIKAIIDDAAAGA